MRGCVCVWGGGGRGGERRVQKGNCLFHYPLLIDSVKSSLLCIIDKYCTHFMYK